MSNSSGEGSAARCGNSIIILTPHGRHPPSLLLAAAVALHQRELIIMGDRDRDCSPEFERLERIIFELRQAAEMARWYNQLVQDLGEEYRQRLSSLTQTRMTQTIGPNDGRCECEPEMFD
ncbi:hypothetical protein PROFUN_11539 [Planoprotostelium fungivorum]|uniref:Uncharacterized protein n=1 Tax=Planoprotostelium fungivorum TaxID=1890364 RepID=A0A2P6NA38_9EUKA|nr:hypothetical protein PROFUN_11539 [Planoprotostelium fungivorum]